MLWFIFFWAVNTSLMRYALLLYHPVFLYFILLTDFIFTYPIPGRMDARGRSSKQWFLQIMVKISP